MYGHFLVSNHTFSGSGASLVSGLASAFERNGTEAPTDSHAGRFLLLLTATGKGSSCVIFTLLSWVCRSCSSFESYIEEIAVNWSSIELGDRFNHHKQKTSLRRARPALYI